MLEELSKYVTRKRMYDFFARQTPNIYGKNAVARNAVHRASELLFVSLESL